MNRIIRLLSTTAILAAATVGLSSCGLEKVPAGHVGVKVYLLGTSKGIDIEELPVGRYWIGWNEELYQFPTFTQNYVWTAGADPGSETNEAITFQDSNGLSISADVGISYHIDAEKVDVVFQKYRRGVEEITDIYLRNMVRDALVRGASKIPVDQIYSTKKEFLIDQALEDVRRQVADIGIVVEKLYWIGSMGLPPQVMESINSKVQATQTAMLRENQIQETIAEARKKTEEANGIASSVTIQANAQAAANELLAKSITPELVQYMAIQKWDGKQPLVVGSGTNLLLDMNKLSENQNFDLGKQLNK